MSPTPIITPSPTIWEPFKRQLWNLPTSSTKSERCTPFTLPAGGHLVVDSTRTIHFTSRVIYQQQCTGSSVLVVDRIPKTVAENLYEPFYGSTTPLVYMVALTTVIAWALIILLMISQGPAGPGSAGPAGLLPARNVGGGMSTRITIFGSGTRPWLQKVAAGLTAISMLVATIDTFKAAEKQYYAGYMNASAMREQVAGTLEIRLLRVFSDIFLWLAQVQTLIRLFPRHKEKLIIKWFGFLLILLDIIFSCLNSFYINTTSKVRSERDAIPALSYLFQLSLSLLYAAWVFYYVATKRRYAFYHRKMPNICIIAFLSIIAVLVPASFFIADIAEPDVSGWGDYFRWVASAASSVIVWEWVERIEALEREEKKDGILGRELFNEDDMQGSNDYSAASSRTYTQSKRHPSDGSHDPDDPSPKVGTFSLIQRRFQMGRAALQRTRGANDDRKHSKNTSSYEKDQTSSETEVESGELGKPVPAKTATPASRTDSVDSTVYAVHYHPVIETPPPATRRTGTDLATQEIPIPEQDPQQIRNENAPRSVEQRFRQQPKVEQPDSQQATAITRPGWNLPFNLFKSRKRSPPLQVKQALSVNEVAQSNRGQNTNDKSILKKLGALTATGMGDRAFRKGEPVPVRQPTIIPAPPRGHAWSPDILRHSPVHTHLRRQPDAERRDEDGRQTVRASIEQTAGPTAAVVKAQSDAIDENGTEHGATSSGQAENPSQTIPQQSDQSVSRSPDIPSTQDQGMGRSTPTATKDYQPDSTI